MVIRTFLSRLRPVAANAVAIALILGFYQLQLVPHISVDTVAFLWQLAIWYLLIFAAFACVAPVGTSKGEHLLRASVKVAMGKYRSVTDEERLVALVVLVKAYFIPIMVQFMIQNFAETVRLLSVLLSDSGITLMSMQGFNILIYPILFATMLVIDVSYFVYGYIVDHPRFGSPIRSVEPTLFGWIVALACYPPFNTMTASLIGWYAIENARYYPTTMWIFLMNIVALILFGIYVWATVALGSRCSNLTNRGIIARGPYAFVRHPAYIAKNAAWIISVLPLLNIAALASVFAWAGIYFLRAITEERHLSRDPDYVAYKKLVPYRFIPYVW